MFTQSIMVAVMVALIGAGISFLVAFMIKALLWGIKLRKNIIPKVH